MQTTSRAPITRIPNEILSGIFLEMFPYPVVFPSSNFSKRLRLMEVCREWQSAALGQVLLWNNVAVRIRIQMKNSPTLERIHACLQLSRNATVSIEVMHCLENESSDEEHSISDLLLPYLHRVTHLKLWTKALMLRSLLSLPRGSFPCLQELSIWMMPSIIDTISFPKEVHTFQGAPRLRSVQVRLPPCSLKDLGIPLSQLHDILFESNSHTPVPPIFADIGNCKLLRSCTLMLYTCQDISTLPNHQMINIPYLKKLRLGSSMLGGKYKTFIPLVAPVLEDLEIASGEWLPSAVASFISLSSCTIRRLTVRSVSNAFLDEYLGHLPAIEVLDMGSMALTSSVIKRISEGAVCPTLKSLKCGVYFSSFRQILDMLVFRAQAQGPHASSRIEDVEISLRSFKVTESLAIEWLTLKGIHITLRTYPESQNADVSGEVYNDGSDFCTVS